MIIYLDESGDLGYNFSLPKTSRYLTIGLLVFPDGATGSAHRSMVRAVKRTRKNKLPNGTTELKGNKLALPIKKYFLREIRDHSNWYLYMVAADKKSWVEYHGNADFKIEKKHLYDELASRVFSSVDGVAKAKHVDLIVDRSKNKNGITCFNQTITDAYTKICGNTHLSIKHRDSQEDACLQAIDIFCSGVGGKYERQDHTWYEEFSGRIVVEREYNF